MDDCGRIQTRGGRAIERSQPAQVFAVAAKIVPWARDLVLLAAFTGLRWASW
jgi:hypothetical protein